MKELLKKTWNAALKQTWNAAINWQIAEINEYTGGHEKEILPALSVRQPWAYLICIGLKDIENRTRRIILLSSWGWYFVNLGLMVNG